MYEPPLGPIGWHLVIDFSDDDLRVGRAFVEIGTGQAQTMQHGGCLVLALSLDLLVSALSVLLAEVVIVAGRDQWFVGCCRNSGRAIIALNPP